MTDYMQLNEFKMLFPEFTKMANGVDVDSVIQFWLDAAQPFVKKSVFLNQTKMAHGYKAATMIASSPYARTLRMEGSESNYDQEFDKILRTVAPRAEVLG